MIEDDSNSDERRWLLDHRRLLDEQRVAQHGFYDRALLTLASGAIAISIPLVSYIATRGEVVAMDNLMLSWFALMASLVCNLVSYITGARDAQREIKAIDHELATGEDTSTWGNAERQITDVLNYASMAMFIAGAVTLLLFAYRNAT